MDRIATGTMIAATALLLTSGLGTDVMAREPVKPPAPAASTLPQPAPPLRSGRILSLLLTLEALHQAPALLDTGKL